MSLLTIVSGGIYANQSNASTLTESDVIVASDVVDSFAAAVSAVVPLDLMPGCKDPNGIMLPQKPFHYCKFHAYGFLKICANVYIKMFKKN